ncbi:MAG: pseudaminic acid synthase [Candidatus Omnitrophica bacterium]|nr:pseudaminic acid synthase [Candidatus Omnitrophota bacterium]
MISEFCIGRRRIGLGNPVYMIAEMSANHNQDFEQAVRILHAAKEAGADAVKLQTYTPDTLTISSDRECFKVKGGTLWDGQTLYELYQQACTPWEWHPKLKQIADDIELDLFSTAFDPSSVDFLEELGMPIHKIASFEIVDLPLIEKAASTGKPLLLSTGMAVLSEIDEAVRTARNAGASQIALFKCVSAYPAPPDKMNLRTIPHLAEAFQVPTGLSDHTLGFTVPVAAVALGAAMIEKHFTLSRDSQSPDAAFSMEPSEFKSMVEAVRIAEQSLGGVQYGIQDIEEKSRVFRRSLFVVKEIKKGMTFTPEHVRSIRPGGGLHTRYYHEIIGRHAACDIEAGTPLSWSLVQ